MDPRMETLSSPPEVLTSSVPINDGVVFDTIVIGGGLSGLTTGYYLLRGGKSVAVLEAGERLGGRTRNVEISVPISEDGSSPKYIPVSIGGTWSMLETDSTDRLIENLNKDDGKESLLYKPDIYPWDSIKNAAPGIANAAYGLACLIYDGYIIHLQSSDDGDWWNTRKAREMDKMRMSKWLKKRWKCSGSVRTAVKLYFNTLESFQNNNFRELSAAFAAIMTFDRMAVPDVWTKPIMQRWHGGTGKFVERVVNAFKLRKGVFQTMAQATLIDQTDDDVVEVTYTDKNVSPPVSRVVRARKVVVATSPNASGFIKYVNPSLPKGAQALYDAENGGILPSSFPGMNIVLVYKTQWWREISPVVSMNITKNMLAKTEEEKLQIGKFGQAFDLTDHHASGPYGIVRVLSFKEAMPPGEDTEEAKVQRAKEFLIHELKGQLGGEDKARKLIDPIIGHAVLTFSEKLEWLPDITYQFPPKLATKKTDQGVRVGQYLIEPLNNVHFAGSERAIRGRNWIEGAIRRGTKVANDLLSLKGFGLKKSIIDKMADMVDDTVDAVEDAASHAFGTLLDSPFKLFEDHKDWSTIGSVVAQEDVQQQLDRINELDARSEYMSSDDDDDDDDDEHEEELFNVKLKLLKYFTDTNNNVPFEWSDLLPEEGSSTGGGRGTKRSREDEEDHSRDRKKQRDKGKEPEGHGKHEL